MVAGYDNIKDHGFDKKSAEERHDLAVKAGKASGEARSKKANFRKVLNQLLTSRIEIESIREGLEAMGLEATVEAALNMAMIKEGMKGNVRAYQAIAEISGQMEARPEDNVENENIKNFLNAVRPTADELQSMFEDDDIEEEQTDEEKET